MNIYLGSYWPTLWMLTWLWGNNKVLELNSARLKRQNKNQVSFIHSTCKLSTVGPNFHTYLWKLRRWQNLEKWYRSWHSKFASKIVKGSANDPEPSMELECKRIAMAISISEGQVLNWTQLPNLPNLKWNIFQIQYI